MKRMNGKSQDAEAINSRKINGNMTLDELRRLPPDLTTENGIEIEYLYRLPVNAMREMLVGDGFEECGCVDVCVFVNDKVIEYYVEINADFSLKYDGNALISQVCREYCDAIDSLNGKK